MHHEPLVDALRVKHVAAGRYDLHSFPVLKVVQAHDAPPRELLRLAVDHQRQQQGAGRLGLPQQAPDVHPDLVEVALAVSEHEDAAEEGRDTYEGDGCRRGEVKLRGRSIWAAVDAGHHFELREERWRQR